MEQHDSENKNFHSETVVDQDIFAKSCMPNIDQPEHEVSPMDRGFRRDIEFGLVGSDAKYEEVPELDFSHWQFDENVAPRVGGLLTSHREIPQARLVV